ncbi:MAG TPA: TolC family protein [Acidobacteriaceae bacterium]|nr:TolC family protein [Acidobacteriaceae bacterium]
MILHETTDRLLRGIACAILLAASVTAGAQQTAPLPNATSPATPPATTTAQPSSSAGPASSPARNQTLPPGEVPGSTPATPAPILGAPPASPTAPDTSAAEPKQATVPGASSATSPGTTPAVSGGQAPASTPAGSASSTSAAAQAATGATSSSVLAFSDALSRASVSSTEYNTAVTESGVAIADRAIARAAVLPTVVYHNQFLYTQGVGVVPITPTTTVRFIANNAVHEYVSQGVANETIGVAGITNYRRANAAIAVANAKLEIARRNLVVAIATSYYTLLSTDKKLAVAQHAQDEADSFVNLTQKLETAGEVAHADVIKAQLQQQQRHRDRIDAQLANERARLDLGVFLFPDPRTAYTLAESQNVPLPTLPPYPDVQAAAAKGNPDLRAATAALRVAQLEVTSARAAYLPDLALNYSYGIDAAQFAIHAPDGTRNLGYSAAATLDIPIFDWFATPARVKQATLRTRLAQLELTAAQRRAIAQLEEFYHEAEAALTELASLDQSVATATESLRLTYMRYRAGEATVLEVVDAQNSASLAESARADGIVRYRVALANLQTLTGSLPQ